MSRPLKTSPARGASYRSSRLIYEADASTNGVAPRAPPRRFSEPVDRIQRFPPGPPSPIRPEPTTVGCRPTSPCTRAPPPCVARNGARTPTGSYMEARGESRGVLGAAIVVWEDRSCTAAPRQPSLSQTNRCLLRAPRTAGRGLLDLCPLTRPAPRQPHAWAPLDRCRARTPAGEGVC